MELKQVIDTAQRYLNGENIPLSDVLDAFKAFIETNTPLTERYTCSSIKLLPQVWEEAEAFGIIITDEEAAHFLFNRFSITDGSLQSIDEDFTWQFQDEFRDAPKGSLFVEALRVNDVERVRTLFEGYSKFKRSADDFVLGDRKTPLEIAVEHNRKEIVEVLLHYGASVTAEIIEKTTDPEIKKILEAAH